MSRFAFYGALCGIVLSSIPARAAIIINEIVYDDGGGDDREYIELYNNGAVPVDISGWVIRNSDTVAAPGDNNADYTIAPATTIAAGGYFVIGNPGVLNVNQTFPTTTALENDNEGVELLDASSVVQDTLIYERNKGVVAISPAEGGFFGNMSNSDAAGTPLNRVTAAA